MVQYKLEGYVWLPDYRDSKSAMESPTPPSAVNNAAPLRVRIEPVEACSPRLRQVMELWRKHRQWLGLFPKGAFESHAVRGGLHAAVLPDGILAGYIASGHTKTGHLWPFQSRPPEVGGWR